MTERFVPGRGLITVHARLTGPLGTAVIRLALDTGATISTINVDILDMVGHESSESQDHASVATGSGIEIVKRLPVHAIEALGIKRYNLPVLSHTLPAGAMVDGLLGLDFFTDQKLIIDFASGTLDVE